MCRSDTLVAKTGRSYRLSRRASMVERGICASAINVSAKSDHENWPQRRRDTERINEPLHERGQLSASHARAVGRLCRLTCDARQLCVSMALWLIFFVILFLSYFRGFAFFVLSFMSPRTADQ